VEVRLAWQPDEDGGRIRVEAIASLNNTSPRRLGLWERRGDLDAAYRVGEIAVAAVLGSVGRIMGANCMAHDLGWQERTMALGLTVAHRLLALWRPPM
jgi:hypothetical protein